MHSLLVLLVVSLGATTLLATDLGPALRQARPCASGGGSSFAEGMSKSGRFVVFTSHANNLATNDSMNPWMDVFLRDLTDDSTTLISVDASGRGGGNADSSGPVVSTNGAWVAFESAADHLVPNDTNGMSDVFLRDVVTGNTRLLSAEIDGVGVNGQSMNPFISDDGRLVVYESTASNLVLGDTNGALDVFLWDAGTQSNRLVSTGLAFPGVISHGGPSHSASVTPDGRFVAFVRSATNEVMADSAVSYGEVLFRDMLSEGTLWLSEGVSSNYSGATPYACSNPTISANGEVVVFKANAGGESSTLYRRSNLRGLGERAEIISRDAVTRGWAQVSMDGRFVAYEAIDGIRVFDHQSSSNRLVLENISGEGARKCTQPAISADGNRTVFLVASNRITSVHVHDWMENDTTVAVVDDRRDPAPVNDSSGLYLNEDGRTVVFDSSSASLVSDDSNQSSDVFAFHLGETSPKLVSVRASALDYVTPFGAGVRLPRSISADGRFVAIASADSGGIDTKRFRDFYVRDLNDGAQYFFGNATNMTRDPVFSADGRYVAYSIAGPTIYSAVWSPYFESVFRRDLRTGLDELVYSPATRESSTLTEHTPIDISPDGNRVAFATRGLGFGTPNILIWDGQTGTNSLVSERYDGLGSGNGSSVEPRFTPDGSWLLFRSEASNLTTNIAHGLYARNLLTHHTILVNPEYAAGAQAQRVSISGDSRFVASISGGSPSEISVYDLKTESRVTVAGTASARSVSLSGNGRWLAWDSSAGASPGVYLVDLAFQTNELISVQVETTEPATRSSDHPLISHDGRYVVFASDATNLVEGDLNNAKDVFIRDRWRGVTMLASINRSGTGSGNGASLLPVLAADGRTLLFQSFASDLIEGDYNETSDVFVLRLGGRDEDGDGMDDDWEVAYFGTTTRDGVGDFDGDGVKDVDEFRLGTDPTNSGSVFQVLKLSREDGMGTKLLWSATPGRAYRVQFKEDLSQEWTEIEQAVTAAGTTAVWTGDSGVDTRNRFYRVVLVE